MIFGRSLLAAVLSVSNSDSFASLVLRTFVSVVSRWLCRRARAVGIRGLLKTGGVTVIQRFGSALHLNVHFHTLMIDGVYELRLGGPPIFHPVPAATDDEVATIAGVVLRQVGEKVARLDDVAEDAAVAGEPLLAGLASALVAGVVATGARRGARVGRVLGPNRQSEATVVGRRCALVDGFSLHANVRIAANDRDGLEHVVRYLARPPIAVNQNDLIGHFHTYDDGTIAGLLRGRQIARALTRNVDGRVRPVELAPNKRPSHLDLVAARNPSLRARAGPERGKEEPDHENKQMDRSTDSAARARRSVDRRASCAWPAMLVPRARWRQADRHRRVRHNYG